MRRMLVIADDFTGAAEMAGIALRCGLPTRLLRGKVDALQDGLTIIDTDTRLLPAEVAAKTLKRALRDVDLTQIDFIYKKTDSAFRGPILAEIETLLELLDWPAAVLVAQNPSRGRIVRNGHYLIDGVPLHQTAFADDPDHPARSSDVCRLLGASAHRQIECVEAGGNVLSKGITIGAAETIAQVRDWTKPLGTGVLPAGGADFFTANLAARTLLPRVPFIQRLKGRRRLFVCGSASDYSRSLIARAKRERVAVCPMPDDVFRGGDVTTWADAMVRMLCRDERVLLTIPQPLDRAAGASQRLQSQLAGAVQRVLTAQQVDQLFLEGGATASAVCRRLGWDMLEVRGELETGVVQLWVASASQSLIIKPGSYPWPDLVWASDDK